MFLRRRLCHFRSVPPNRGRRNTLDGRKSLPGGLVRNAIPFKFGDSVGRQPRGQGRPGQARLRQGMAEAEGHTSRERASLDKQLGRCLEGMGGSNRPSDKPEKPAGKSPVTSQAPPPSAPPRALSAPAEPPREHAEEENTLLAELRGTLRRPVRCAVTRGECRSMRGRYGVAAS